jgi:hypothetical protein
MNMDIFVRYPELKEKFGTLCQSRRNEILAHMMETDSKYDELSQKRADASMVLKEVIDDTEADVLFEAYSDAVYAQEVYELDAVYKQAFCDALNALKEQGIL